MSALEEGWGNATKDSKEGHKWLGIAKTELQA